MKTSTSTPPSKKNILNEREITIIRLICRELTNDEIAVKMKLHRRTVEGYRLVLMRKLRKKTAVGLAIYAIKNGIISI
jgi:two-component system, NarL family, invasion response regulator UvrY